MSTLRVSTLTARTGTGNVAVPTGNKIVGVDIGSVYAPGSVIQVAYASSGPARQIINTTTPTLVTGLSIVFTPRYANSLIVVQAQIMSNLAHVSSFAVYQNGAATVSTAGQTNQNEPNMNVTTYIGGAGLDELWCIPVIWGGSAGNTSSRTYAIYGTAGWAGTTYALNINNRNSNDMAGFSTMIVMEVAQ
jgi:hypothetical protein